MTRPAFCRIPRTDGRYALIRADMITALLPGETRTKGSDEVKPEVTVQVGATVVVHTNLTVDQIAHMVLNATGQPVVIQEPPAA